MAEHDLHVVARSAAMREALRVAERLAPGRTPVLLTGESGTGKDLMALWLHWHGPRREKPFLKISCPTLPPELVESELFGHERGAFTDARQAKPGKLELAEGGTVFLDQVEELDLPVQAKLLRVVEERRFERVGGTRIHEVDVRFVAASGVDLGEAVAAGRFRADLFHRLNVVTLVLPPLRARREEVGPLAELFLARLRAQGATAATGFATEVLSVLRGYAWPGNVRELRSVVSRAALATAGARIEVDALPRELLARPEPLWLGPESPPTLREVEEAYIRWVLSREKPSSAARVLGISRKALWEKRRRLGISGRGRGPDVARMGERSA